MTLRTKRILLYLMAAFLTLLAAVPLILALKLPVAVPKVDSPSLGGQMPAGTTANVPPLESFPPLWQRPWRAPLYDAPPPIVQAAEPAQPLPLNLRLAGTIIEPGRNRAMIVTPDGKMQFVRVGDKVGDAEVLSIDLTSVTVSYLGQPRSLQVEREKRGK